jgi:tetratricopeptide (TPR) repeat protein
MRKFFLILVSWTCMSAARSQPYNLDSLRYQLSKSKPDTNRLILLQDLSYGYIHFHPDSSYYFGREEYLLAQGLKDLRYEAISLRNMSTSLAQMGNYPKALEFALKSLRICEQLKQPDDISRALRLINTIYYYQKDGKNCIAYAWKEMALNNGTKDPGVMENFYIELSGGYEMMNMKDSNLFYQLKALQTSLEMHDERNIAFNHENLADAYFDLNKDSEALLNYGMAIPYFATHHIEEGTCESALYLARIFERRNRPDSAIWYGKQSLLVAKSSMLTSRQSDASDFLAAFYKKRHQPDSALEYLELSVALKDSLFNQEKVQEIENMTFDENNRQQELQDEKKKEHEASVRNLQLIAIAIFIPVFFLFVLFLGRIKVKARLVEFLAIVDLLLFFEFITDLIFPYISNWTNDRPIGEMLILVLIAAALEPLNFGFEKWVKKHLVDKPVFAPVLVENTSSDDEIKGNQSLLL